MRIVSDDKHGIPYDERITGEHDPKDPDGLLTDDPSQLDADDRDPDAPLEETASDHYPTVPSHHGVTQSGPEA